MKPQEEIAALKKENAELQKRIQELEASKKPSKSRQQAEEGLKMLQQGPVSKAQFATLNEKYPSDVPFFIRNTMKIDVHTVRGPEGTRYMLQKDFDAFQAEKLKKSESAEEVTEAIHQASTETSAASLAV